MMNRRSFLKKIGLVVAISSTPLWPQLLPAPNAATINLHKKYKDNFLQLIQSELNAFPSGSIAHKIVNMEFVVDERFFGNTLRGLVTHPIAGISKHYWMVRINSEELIYDYGKRRKFVDELVSMLTKDMRDRKKRL